MFDIGSTGQGCAVCNCGAKWCLWIDAQNFGKGLPHVGKVAACFAAFLALQFQEAHRWTEGQQHLYLTISLHSKILGSYILLRF